MVIFYKKWIQYNGIQLTKNKMDLNIRKITNHSPSPYLSYKNCLFFRDSVNSLVQYGLRKKFLIVILGTAVLSAS